MVTIASHRRIGHAGTVGERRRKTIHGYLSFGRSEQPGATPPSYRWDERWPTVTIAVAVFVAITIGDRVADSFWTQAAVMVGLVLVVGLVVKSGFAAVEWLVRRRSA